MPLQWSYSRSQHRHWIEDGQWYGRKFERLYVIRDCRQFGFIHKPDDGYDLFFKGKKLGHAKTVKKLKTQAQEHHDRQQR